MRVPVRNDAARSVARNVEVYLNSLKPLDGQSIDHFIPMRLLWCHADSPVCDRIAGETTKLINLGRSYPKGRTIADGKLLPIPEPPHWVFGGEAWSFAPELPLTGVYEIELVFTHEGYPPACQRVSIDFTADAEKPEIRTK
jgi:hypothetical protein